MFEDLAKHKKILVTGPHRSMTTFAATAIAHDTGHGLVREELTRFSLAGVEHWLLHQDAPVVVQAPFAAPVCHQFPGVFVVFMRRPVEEIKASQQRMFLPDGTPVQWDRMEIGARQGYNTTEGDIADIKYESWDFQKERCLNMELDVEVLKEHTLYVQAGKRKDFHVRQTSAVD